MLVSRSFLADYCAKGLVSPPSVDCLRPVVRWSPPLFGLYKINTDATIDFKSNRVGLGAVIRNSDGQVMALCAKHLHIHCSVVYAEAMALLCGALLASDSGLYPAVLETDALSIIELV
ncbi:hypothetical protein ACOSQ2_002255 [Xanthoceras sorbifolium]